MAIPLLIAGAVIVAGVAAHSKDSDVNEEAKNIASHADSIYSSQKWRTEKAKKNVLHELEKVGRQKQMILLYPMKSFLETYGRLKKVGLIKSQGIEELENLPQFNFGDQDALQLEKLTDIYQSVKSSAAEGAAAGALAGLAATGTGGLLTAAGTAGTFSAVGVAGAAVDIAGTAIGAVAAAPLALFVAPVAVFTGLSALSNANENLSKAKSSLAQAERACEEMENIAVLCEGIVKKADMFEKLMLNLTELFSQCLVLQNAIIRKKDKKKQRLSRDAFTDEELKVFAVSRSLAGALKALIDVPILDDGEISQEAEQKYQTVLNSLPSYENNVKEIQTVAKGLKVNVKKEKQLLLEPVADAIMEENPKCAGRERPTGPFADGWRNKAFVFSIRLLATVLMCISLYFGTYSILLQGGLLAILCYLSSIDEKYSFWHKKKVHLIGRIFLGLAGLYLMGRGVAVFWTQSRYLASLGWFLFGLFLGVCGLISDKDDNETYTKTVMFIPFIILVAQIAGKILGWIF